MKPIPKEILFLNAHDFKIIWNDNHESTYVAKKLRLECPCAGCTDEMTRVKMISEAQIPDNIAPISFEPIGNYAYAIHWSDGHNTGFFTFEFLRQLCSCPLCK